MINIRPISDLRNKFTEIEEVVLKNNAPVFLTKNGYGTMVIMSIEDYSKLVNSYDVSLLEADNYAESTTTRLSHDEVFAKVRRRINKQENKK